MYTVEELLLDDTFVDFCVNEDSVYKNKWHRIINEHATLQPVFDEAKELVIALNGGLNKNDVNAEIEKLKQQLLIRENNNAANLSEDFYVNRKGLVRKINVQRLVGYAAAACIIVFVSVFVFKKEAVEKINSVAVNTAPLQYRAAFGEQRQVSLPDGSVVILNSNSSIVLDKNYNQQQRLITLTGDAFFSVAKNAAKPFIVKSEAFSTTALGTQFYVHARTPLKNYQVELLEGKVKLEKANTEAAVILEPGTQAVITNTDKAFKKSAMDGTGLQEWVSGKISFDKTPVKEALIKLEKWYDVSIEVKQAALLNQQITGQYSYASLQNILDVICFSLSCKYHISGNNVTIE